MACACCSATVPCDTCNGHPACCSGVFGGNPSTIVVRLSGGLTGTFTLTWNATTSRWEYSSAAHCPAFLGFNCLFVSGPNCYEAQLAVSCCSESAGTYFASSCTCSPFTITFSGSCPPVFPGCGCVNVTFTATVSKT